MSINKVNRAEAKLRCGANSGAGVADTGSFAEKVLKAAAKKAAGVYDKEASPAFNSKGAGGEKIENRDFQSTYLGLFPLGRAKQERHGYKNAANLSGSIMKREDKSEKALQGEKEQEEQEKDILEMKKLLDEKFYINTVVINYGFEKADAKAELNVTAMLEKYDMHGAGNVAISKTALTKMKKDGAFRKKVYKTIEDIPWSGKLTSGYIKGNGVFIHEDGTGGYYMEFDWHNEDGKTKSKKHRVLYFKGSEVKELNAPALDVITVTYELSAARLLRLLA